MKIEGEAVACACFKATAVDEGKQAPTNMSFTNESIGVYIKQLRDDLHLLAFMIENLDNNDFVPVIAFVPFSSATFKRLGYTKVLSVPYDIGTYSIDVTQTLNSMKRAIKV